LLGMLLFALERKDWDKNMSNAAILSIRPVYASQILARKKTIELRRSDMGLAVSDVVLFYVSAPDQRLGGWFRIAKIEILGVDEMWSKQHELLGINHDDYLKYFEGAERAFGLHVGEMRPLEKSISLTEIQNIVPGFVPPQGLIWIKQDLGRFANLLSRIHPPLPDDVFPQLSLFESR